MIDYIELIDPPRLVSGIVKEKDSMAGVLEDAQQQNEEVHPDTPHLPPPETIMQKFRLYETRSV